MNVVIISTKEEYNKQSLNRLEKYSHVEWINDERIELSKLDRLSNENDKIVALSPVPFDWKIPAEFYKSLNSVKYICLVTTSYGFLDLDFCKSEGVKVTNVPYYSTNAVAEYAIYMMISLFKRFPIQLKNDFKYEFTDETLMNELTSKSVGVIGLGHIGKRIIKLADGLGMKTYYWSRRKKKVNEKYLSLKSLLQKCDVVFPTVIESKETHNLLDKKMLENLKSNSYFVSIVSDEIWDKEYLLKRVGKSKLGGLAFESAEIKMADVKGNVFITAPLAWYTDRSLENNINDWTETIISCIKGKPRNLVTLGSK
ncbi:hypothetical protein JW710_02415 [Candidatus Dojkabacteria bacterium]|nr:hypothetical protein [Candidatus Dojkabacteria bacterium]